MGKAAPTRQTADQWVADLPAPAIDGREPWPVLSFSPAARALAAQGQTQWTALDALPSGRDAAQQRPPRSLPAGMLPVPVPQPVPATTPRRAPVNARPIAVARGRALPPVWPPRVLRMATPPAYPAPPHPGGPIRGHVPEAAKRSLAVWAFAALVLGLASLAPMVWETAPLAWVPATGFAALFCSLMVFSQARRGITPRGTISAARWGCAFALLATALWVLGVLLATGQIGAG
jgi:hypothetical protein